MNTAVQLNTEITAVKVETLPPEGAGATVLELGTLIERASHYSLITNQEQLSQGNECLARLREAANNMEKMRVFMKAPILEAGRRVDEQFKPRQDALTEAIKLVNKGTTAYMLAEQKRMEDEERARRKAEQDRLAAEAAERRKQEAAAEAEKQRLQRERDAQLEAAAKAEAEGNAAAAAAALEQAQKSEQAAASANAQAQTAQQEAQALATAGEAVAAAPVQVEVRSTGTLGSKAKLKPVKAYKIMDIKLVPEQYLIAPEERLNKTLVRATMNSNVPIPGIEYYEEYTTSTRASAV